MPPVRVARKRSATAAQMEAHAAAAVASSSSSSEQQLPAAAMHLQQHTSPSQPALHSHHHHSRAGSSMDAAVVTLADSTDEASVSGGSSDADTATGVGASTDATAGAAPPPAEIQTPPRSPPTHAHAHIHTHTHTHAVAAAPLALQPWQHAPMAVPAPPATPRRGRTVAPLVLGGRPRGSNHSTAAAAAGAGPPSWRSEVAARIQRSVTMGTHESMMAAASAHSGSQSVGGGGGGGADSPRTCSPRDRPMAHPSMAMAGPVHPSPLQTEPPHTPLRLGLTGGPHSASSLLAARLSHASSSTSVAALAMSRGSSTTSAHASPAMGSSRSRSLSQTLGAIAGFSLAAPPGTNANSNSYTNMLGLGQSGGAIPTMAAAAAATAAGNNQHQQQPHLEGNEVPASLFSFHSANVGSMTSSSSSASSPLFSPSSCATPLQHASSVGATGSAGLVPPLTLGGIPLPDFTQVDQAKHASPALRHRAARGAHHPPPSPGVGGRSLIGLAGSGGHASSNHSHSSSFNESLSMAGSGPLSALFASAGSYSSYGGGGGAVSAASSTPSTPSRSVFKRRLLDKTDLEKEVKLFSFVSAPLLRQCLGPDAAEGVQVGPEHSYSVVKAATAQAAAQAAAAAHQPAQAPTPVGVRSPLFTSAPSPSLLQQQQQQQHDTGLPPTPSRAGAGSAAGGISMPSARAARSPGLQPASSCVLFSPLTLPVAHLSTHQQQQQQQQASTQQSNQSVHPPPSHPASMFGLHYGALGFPSGHGGASSSVVGGVGGGGTALSFGMPPLNPPFRSRSSSLVPTVPLFTATSSGASAAASAGPSSVAGATGAIHASSTQSSCSRFLPFVSYTLHGRLGAGSFGDVFHVSVDRDEWNQTQYPASMLPLPPLALPSADAHAVQNHSQQGQQPQPVMLEFAVKKSRLPFKSLQARSRTLHQYQLLHTLFTNPDSILTPSAAAAAAATAATGGERSSAGCEVPRWHPNLVQVHAVWQESPGVLHECMELCPAPQDILPYLHGHTAPRHRSGGFGPGSVASATMEEYFLAFRARADRAAQGLPPLDPALLCPPSPGTEEEGAFKTPRVSDGPPGPPPPSVCRRLLSGDDDEMSDCEASPAPIQRTPHPSTDSDGEGDEADARGAERSLPQFPLAWHPASASAVHPHPAHPPNHSQAHTDTLPLPHGAHVSYDQNQGVHPCEIELCRALEQVGGALLYLHQHSLLHFDTKPGNIFCTAPSSASSDPSSSSSSASSGAEQGEEEEESRTVFKLGDYGSLVHVSDYLRSDGAAGLGGMGFEPEEGDGDFLAPELLNPLPCLRPPRRCSYSMLGGVSHPPLPGQALSLLSGGVSGGGGGSGGQSASDSSASLSGLDAEAATKETARQQLAASLAPAIDVYSLGMSAFSVITGRLLRRRLTSPLPRGGHAGAGEAMSHGGGEADAPMRIDIAPAHPFEDDPFSHTLFPVSDTMRNLVSSMLELDPRERTTMAEVVRRAKELRAHHAQTKANAKEAQTLAQAQNSGEASGAAETAMVPSSDGSGVSSSVLPSATAMSMSVSIPDPDPSSLPSSAAVPDTDMMMEGVETGASAMQAPAAATVPSPLLVHSSPGKRLSMSVSLDLCSRTTTAALASSRNGANESDALVYASLVSSSPISPATAPPAVGGGGGYPSRRAQSRPASVVSVCGSLVSTPSSSRVGSSMHSSSNSLGGGVSQNLSMGIGIGMGIGMGLGGGGMARRPSGSPGSSLSCSVSSSSPLGALTLASGSNSPPHSGSECSSNATSPPISASVSPMLSFITSTSELRISAFPIGSGFGPGQTAPWATPQSNASSAGSSASKSTSFFVPRNVAGAGGGGGGGGNGRALLAHLQMLPSGGGGRDGSARRGSGNSGTSRSSAHTPLQPHVPPSHTPPSLVGGAVPVVKRQSLHVPGTRSGSSASSLLERGAALADGHGRGRGRGVQRRHSLCNPHLSAAHAHTPVVRSQPGPVPVPSPTQGQVVSGARAPPVLLRADDGVVVDKQVRMDSDLAADNGGDTVIPS